MTTKYILGGGYMWKAPAGGKAFCEELVKGFQAPVRILECIFAAPQEQWEEKFISDQAFFCLASRDLP